MHQFANTSVFVESTVVAEEQVVVVDPAVPARFAALLGCGVLTGTGAVFNRAKVARGDRVFRCACSRSKHLATVGVDPKDTKITYYDVPPDAWGVNGGQAGSDVAAAQAKAGDSSRKARY